MFRSTVLAAVVLALASTTSSAAVKTQQINYKHGNVECHGFLAYDDAIEGKRPGILLVHEWWGLNDYARHRAEMLAELGYVAFAADMYGEGKSTEHPQEAGAMAGEVRKNVADWVARATEALNVLKAQPQCDSSKLGTIGYCFGGSTALQLALSGADIKCAVSFHGALPATTAEQAKKTKATILICHGADDSFIPEDAVQKFRKALSDAGVDWEMDYYSGAQHSFTVKSADARGLKGMAYNEHADQRSWQRMQDLFKAKFGE
jgi:dienelactone hydrolase